MIKAKAKMMGFLMAAALVLSVPLVYADSGNGGNSGGGPSSASDGQSSSGQGDHEWGHHGGKHGGHMNGGFFHHLTDDQKKQLKDIWQKQREATKATFEQIKTDKEALTNELLQTTPDMNKINGLKSKLEASVAQMLDNRINSDLEAKKILTAEQFAKYLEFQKHKFAGRFHKGEWGHRGDGEGGGHWRHCSRHHRGYDNEDNG